MRIQPDLPEEYAALTAHELADRIAARKEHLGKDLCILGHHYQSDAIIQFADFVGDSLKLSQQAASQNTAKYIVFCGVHFMAESADILSGPDQTVILPNLRAGCAMADMADNAGVETALDELTALTDDAIIPITYVNSTAAIKATTARHGGACCTSSNVKNVFDWALRPASQDGADGKKIFAIPDEHLARNTAVAMGYSPDDCLVYDPAEPHGGLSRHAVQRATFILWKGFCYVHQQFKPAQIAAARAADKDIRVIVHPECPYDVVRLSDASGSTEQIMQAVAAGQPGSRWAIGTEINFVNRLAQKHPDRLILSLAPIGSMCVQMARIELPYLLLTLDQLAEGCIVNPVRVDPETADAARTALQRMIDIKAASGLEPKQ